MKFILKILLLLMITTSGIQSAPPLMGLHAKFNLTKHDQLDTPLIELIPQLADVTTIAVEECHESIHSQNSSHSALFVRGALLRDVLHEFFSHFNEKTITASQVTSLINSLTVIVDHVLQCNPLSEEQKNTKKYRKPRWKAGLTVVSDMAPELLYDMNNDRGKIRLRDEPEGTFAGSCDSLKLVEESELPARHDLRDKYPDMLNAIRSQGSCKSCWAFASIGISEAALLNGGYNIPPLSPQYLLDFDDNEFGCDGGTVDSALNWIAGNGLVSEESYPYQGEQQTGKEFKDPEYLFSGFCFHYGRTISFEERKRMVYTAGGLFLGLNIGSSFHAYKSGIYEASDCLYTEHGHALTVIGYGEDYLLARNSWSEAWGMNGFMMINPYTCLCQYRAGYMIVP